MDTNVPLPEFTDAGLLTFSEQQILAGVQADYVAAFAQSGKTLGTELTTPQGQLETSNAYMVAAFQAMLAKLIANVDPLTASGAYQDALMRIYFLTRKPATYATVPAVLGGVPGQPVAAGAQVISGDKSIWTSQAATVFAPDGTASVTFQALVAGSGPVAGINDLRIYQRQNGWQTVANATGSTPGRDVESRTAAEVRRQESVNIGGNGTADAVRAAVLNVTNVTDAFVYNNGDDVAITYGVTNYPIPAHSILISVTGGTDQDVALAINAKLDAGCGMSSQGATTVTLTDSVNYSAPYPQYPIRFVRPAAKQVYLTINVADRSTLPSDFVLQVQRAVAAAFLNGYAAVDGSITIARARIGAQILADAYAPIVAALPDIALVSTFIGFASAPTTGAAVTLGVDQQPVCPQLNITVNRVTP